MQRPKVSLKYIANQLGISPTTVSFVLNGKQRERRISDELSKKVLDLAKELRYEPNHIAKGLRTGKTKTIGLIVEDIANHFFSQVAKVVEGEALKYGYKVLYCSTDGDTAKAKELLYMLSVQLVDGFIITPTDGMESDIQALLNDNKSVVLMDRYLPSLETNYVVIDNEKGAYDATKHLIEEGNKDILLVSTDSTQVQMEARRQGYKKALKEKGIKYRSKNVLEVPFLDLEGASVLLIANKIKSVKPDAVFFATNYLGVSGLEALKSLPAGLAENIAVVSFDDNPLFKLYEPGITCIAQPVSEIAHAVIKTLLDDMKHKSDEQKHIILEPQLIVRKSSCLVREQKQLQLS